MSTVEQEGSSAGGGELTISFTPEPGNPLAAEHKAIAEYFQIEESAGWKEAVKLRESFSQLPAAAAKRFAEATIEQLWDQAEKERLLRATKAPDRQLQKAWSRRSGLKALLERQFWHGLPVSDSSALVWLHWSVSVSQLFYSHNVETLLTMTEICEGAVARTGNAEPHRGRLHQLVRMFLSNNDVRRVHSTRVFAIRDRLGIPADLMLGNDRRISQAIANDLAKMAPDQHDAWMRLLEHLGDSSAAQPTGVWFRQTNELLANPHLSDWQKVVASWLEVFSYKRGEDQFEVNPANGPRLKGLGWLCSIATDPAVVRKIPDCAAAAYQDVYHWPAYATAVGNAFIKALGLRGDPWSIEQLALLRARIKRPGAQKCLEQALLLAAKKTKTSPEELAEANVPTYGFTEVGKMELTVGDYRGELVVERKKAEVRWKNAAGESVKALPKSVQTSHAPELKSLKSTAKEIEKMLPAQVQRLEAFFLEDRQWDIANWRRYYLDHPLMGVLARRLIWNFHEDSGTRAGLWHEGSLADASGAVIPTSDATRVTLWHPMQCQADEVRAWRERLQAILCTQPFKQAHREVYRLTPAEAESVTYSNRFAAHILKQHQFHALALGRGWKHAFNGAFGDGGSDAKRDVKAAKLRAEFWVRGAGEETSDAGVFLYLSTDQVRFLPLEGRSAGPDPIRLVDVPPVVFSEIMRDVDLFVGVSSVGADPEWPLRANLPDGHGYWSTYAFGNLSATAETRRDVLTTLVPKLKIARQCSFEERFLVVQGKLRRYKIHLGSGNVLMSPNDQYLCIVPERPRGATESLFLPFEGDQLTSVILSKAFLLAADDKIKDPAILGQMK